MRPFASAQGDDGRPRVVIVGAGFGGLRVARRLAKAPVDVLLVDRHNYHCFLPLLYQVATAGLEPEEIAQGVRSILRRTANVQFRMADVTAIDLDRQLVLWEAGEISYDFLVLAAGSATNYFGMTDVARFSFGLKELNDATSLRSHLLTMFERAAFEPDRQKRAALMTTAVVGGGPTGVELAGALAELKRHVLPRDYPRVNLREARVLLLEATDRLLVVLPPRLQARALERLERLGVEVVFDAAVSDVNREGLTLKDGRTIATATVIWVAGVRAAPLTEALPVETRADGRVVVEPTMQLPSHPQVFAIGDMAYREGADGRPYPQVAPVAVQQGELVATNIRRRLRGEPLRPFRYKDQGTLTTIGRSSAVAHVYGLQFSGFIAWVIWLVVHIIQLIGFRNKLLVLVNWAWNYFTYDRGVRLITRD